MPRRWEPMLAATGRPSTPLAGWAVEPKLDGWRAIVEVGDGRVCVYSRNGHDLTERVPCVQQLAPFEGLVLDGEIVSGDGSLSSFYGLLGALRRGSVAFVAFDCLAAAGDVLVARSYRVRRSVLETLALPTPIVPSLPGADVDDLLAACEHGGMEGVVLKRVRSIYRPGQRTADWRKVKCESWREHLERRMADHA